MMAGHPSIAQVAVIGFPDEVQGEEICAVVVRAPEGEDLDADPLIAWCKERLGGHNPRRIEFLAALPLGPSGKIPNANWSRTCSPTAGGGAGLVAGSSIPTRAPSPPRASPRRRPTLREERSNDQNPPLLAANPSRAKELHAPPIENPATPC